MFSLTAGKLELKREWFGHAKVGGPIHAFRTANWLEL